MANNHVTAEGELYYPKLFPQNKEVSEYTTKTEGSYNTVFIPASDEELNKFLDAGYPKEAMGHPMIKEYPVAGGRKGIKLKRPHVHPSGIEDFGGAPKVLDFTQGQGEKLWDFDVDGALGNGTKAKVKASIYVPEKGSKTKGSITRLEAIAVTEHVEFKERAESEMVW